MLLVPVRAESIESPSDMLKRTSDDVIKVLKEKREMLEKEPDLVYQIVDQYILPHLDDVTMAKLALGKNWRNATNEQKIAFVDEFRDLLIRTYSKSLQEFRDQTITFFPVDIASNEEKAIVKSEILQSGGPTIPVAYRVRIKDNSWKVYDISIDGVSLVTSYRGTFTQEVRKSGIDGLLLLLRDKNAVIPVDKNTKETES
jgi:phospholipid transport system substrate-binding protein